MDSLRYWVSEMHVDGFRFDLAPVLGRGDHGFEPRRRLLHRRGAGPGAVARQADRRALGHRPRRLPGRQLSARLARMERPLPRRDARLLAADGDGARAATSRCACAPRPTCSSRAAARRPSRSTTSSRTTASRCATWSATTQRHNQANGEDNRDGHGHNLSCNCGVEGADRRRRRCNALRGAPAARAAGHHAAGAGHADAVRRRRTRPQPARQQQPLLPGQRDHLDRLVARRRRPDRLHRAACCALRRQLLPFGNHWYSGLTDTLRPARPGLAAAQTATRCRATTGATPAARVLGCLIGQPGRATRAAAAAGQRRCRRPRASCCPPASGRRCSTPPHPRGLTPLAAARAKRRCALPARSLMLLARGRHRDHVLNRTNASAMTLSPRQRRAAAPHLPARPARLRRLRPGRLPLRRLAGRGRADALADPAAGRHRARQLALHEQLGLCRQPAADRPGRAAAARLAGRRRPAARRRLQRRSASTSAPSCRGAWQRLRSARRSASPQRASAAERADFAAFCAAPRRLAGRLRAVHGAGRTPRLARLVRLARAAGRARRRRRWPQAAHAACRAHRLLEVLPVVLLPPVADAARPTPTQRGVRDRRRRADLHRLPERRGLGAPGPVRARRATAGPRSWPACRPTSSAPPASAGATRCTAGARMPPKATPGGSQRMRRTFELVDIVRIDHFRGFAGYWEIPASEPTAIKGRWLPGPGAALFEAIASRAGPAAHHCRGPGRDHARRGRAAQELRPARHAHPAVRLRRAATTPTPTCRTTTTATPWSTPARTTTTPRIGWWAERLARASASTCCDYLGTRRPRHPLGPDPRRLRQRGRHRDPPAAGRAGPGRRTPHEPARPGRRLLGVALQLGARCSPACRAAGPVWQPVPARVTRLRRGQGPKTASGHALRPYHCRMTTKTALLADDDCYLALKAKDARFDGRFFTGVTSTGIYCRPVCSVKTPRRENCRFFRHAAQAESAGFGPACAAGPSWRRIRWPGRSRTRPTSWRTRRPACSMSPTAGPTTHLPWKSWPRGWA